MICIGCKSEMILDDRDYNFKGCYDNYWECGHCTGSCREEVRFSRSFKEIWHFEDGCVKDLVIRK